MDTRREKMLAQGVIAGAIGYATVVLYFGLLSLATGHSIFYTPALLGHTLLGTLHDPAHVSIDPAPILVYNGLHLVVFLIIGIAASWLVFEVERRPQLWYLLLFLVLFVFFHLLGVVLAFVAPAAATLPMWTALGVSLAAVLTMGGYLWLSHPRLGGKIAEVGDFEDLGEGR